MFRSTGWTWSATILAAVFLILVIADTVLDFQNRALQIDINQRQQYITQSARLSQIEQALVRALAPLSVKNAGIKQVLTAAGLRVTYTPDAASAPAGSTATPEAPHTKPSIPGK